MEKIYKYRSIISVVLALIISPIIYVAVSEQKAKTESVSTTEVIETTTDAITTEVETTVENTIESTTVTEAETVTEEETTCTPAEDENLNAYDLYYMAHLIYAEAGSSWCSDELQLYVGSVVLNRVESDQFPNTIRDVIYQDGQYACTWDGNFEKEPDERAWKNAEIVLVHGSQLPDNVVYQAEFKQGSGVYCKVGNTYFCY
jgi:spore germination cell wall hydrolase CwlJ-like protein